MTTLDVHALGTCAWPAGDLAFALVAPGSPAAWRERPPMAAREPTRPPQPLQSAWLDAQLESQQLYTDSADVPLAELADFLRAGAPVLLELACAPTAGARLLLVRRQPFGRFVLSTPSGLQRVQLDALAPTLVEYLAPELTEPANTLCNALSLAGKGGARARAAWLLSHAGSRRVRAWRLRPRPSSRLIADLWRSPLPKRVSVLFAAHAAQASIAIAFWWFVGERVLAEHVDRASLGYACLLLAALVSSRAATLWASGVLALELGAELKERVMLGVLGLDADRIRPHGAGQLNGRVLETESLERHALDTVAQTLTGLAQLAVSIPVLAAGAGGWSHVCCLLGYTVLVAWLAWRYAHTRQLWSDRAVTLTHVVVANLEGHQTRIIQQHPDAWHAEEDAALAGYAMASRHMDAASARLMALAPRAWWLVGLSPLLLLRPAPSAASTSLAIALGGIVSAQRALVALVAGLASAAAAWVAWRHAALLVKEGVTARSASSPVTLAPAEPPRATETRGTPIVHADRVTFRHATRTKNVLQDCDLEIFARERVLIEGRSGSGKSTLVSLLAGLRSVDEGQIRYRGTDVRSLRADAWRHRVVLVPQFQENYVFMGTLAFNLLLGRSWPASAQDLQDAERVCRAIGLGPLLDHMPNALHQWVGESGWRLSHGERSLLYIARALLQRGELLVFDESFGTLDPQSMQHALEHVLASEGAIAVIAHP